MRITLWREFSSNHSGRFTVVGVFDSPEAAQRAADEVNNIARAVQTWYEQPENADALESLSSGAQDPSPIERQVAAHYGLDWGEYAVDWLWHSPVSDGPARVIDRLVLIDGTESDFGAHPADRLIERLGGLPLIDGVIVRDEDDATIYIYLSCLAPDEATAEAIRSTVRSRLASWDREPDENIDTMVYRDWRPSRFTANIRVEGRRLLVERGEFYPFFHGFTDLWQYLEAMGCTEIEYLLAEEREGEGADLDFDWR